MPQVKIRTQAAVLRPTPGSASQELHRLGSRGAVSVQSRSGCSPSCSRICLDPRRLLLAQTAGADRLLDLARPARRAPPPRSGSARAAPAKARSRLRSLVCWESTVLISSAIGWPCGSLTGLPYISRSRSRIARTRRLSGRFQAMGGPYARHMLWMAAIEEGELVVDGVRVFYRRVPGEGTPIVYCHGNPTHGEDWVPFMERGAAVDRDRHAGLGALGPPGPEALRLLDVRALGLPGDAASSELGIDRRKLVVHDWGSLALIGAQRRPDLVEKLVVMNAYRCCPATAGTGWPRSGAGAAVGELANATTTKSSMALIMRQALGDRRPMPPQFVDMIWRHWTQAPTEPSSPSTATPTQTASPSPARPRPAHLPRPGPLGRQRPLPPTTLRRGLRRQPSQAQRSSSSTAPATGPGSTMLA